MGYAHVINDHNNELTLDQIFRERVKAFINDSTTSICKIAFRYVPTAASHMPPYSEEKSVQAYHLNYDRHNNKHVANFFREMFHVGSLPADVGLA